MLPLVEAATWLAVIVVAVAIVASLHAATRQAPVLTEQRSAARHRRRDRKGR
jgi:hypothetical protein